MATTTPDNIYSPDAGQQYALTQDLLAMADSVQSALLATANTIRGDLSPSPASRVRSWVRGTTDSYVAGSFVGIANATFTNCRAGLWLISMSPVISSTVSNAGDTEYWAGGVSVISLPRDVIVGTRSSFPVTVPYVLPTSGDLAVRINDFRSAGVATVFATTRIDAVWVG